MTMQTRHPEWRDSTPADPSERAAELARRQETLRDQTLQDYAAMDERAEMRAANAAAAARAAVGDDLAGVGLTAERAARADAARMDTQQLDAARKGIAQTDIAQADAAQMDAARMDAVDASAASPETDLGAELGLHSPLKDRFGTPRTALDDGAPLARGTYDDDDRRYAAQEETDESSDEFVDARDPRNRSGRASSEWSHMKQVVREAWHKVTHPGRHH
jgi:hypothetical protein